MRNCIVMGIETRIFLPWSEVIKVKRGGRSGVASRDQAHTPGPRPNHHKPSPPLHFSLPPLPSLPLTLFPHLYNFSIFSFPFSLALIHHGRYVIHICYGHLTHLAMTPLPLFQSLVLSTQVDRRSLQPNIPDSWLIHSLSTEEVAALVIDNGYVMHCDSPGSSAWLCLGTRHFGRGSICHLPPIRRHRKLRPPIAFQASPSVDAEQTKCYR
jgi:hypothetical protein